MPGVQFICDHSSLPDSLDINLMNCLIMDGFQYPVNPDWNVREDELQGPVQATLEELQKRKGRVGPAILIISASRKVYKCPRDPRVIS
jgi:hypothetical protein